MFDFASGLDRWEIIGLLGAFTYTAAYVLAALDWVTSKSPYYYLMNMVAAGLVLCSLYVHYNVASVVIQIFFVTVSFVGMWRHIGTHSRSHESTARMSQNTKKAPLKLAEPWKV